MISKAKLKKAIEGSYGNITVIASKLKCARKTVYEKLNKYPELWDVIDDEREKIVDLAENKMLTAINNGSETMISLVLRTLGKKRGYVEKQEIDASNKVEITVVNNLDD